LKLSANAKSFPGTTDLQPLLGTPFYCEGSFEEIAETAIQSAFALCNGGAEGCTSPEKTDT